MSENVLSKDVKVTEKLDGLAIPVMELLGKPHRWALGGTKRIQHAEPADRAQ